MRHLSENASLMVASALLAVTIAGCAYMPGLDGGARPFAHYEIVLKDPSLKVIGVTGRLFGPVGGEVVLRPLRMSGGGELQPIDLVATTAEGERLAVEIREGDYIVEAKGQDFAFSYDLVLTVEDRYSPDVGAMLTFLDSDRCRMIGRDILLIPEVPLSPGVIVDVGLFSATGIVSPWRSNGSRMVVPRLEELPHTMVVSGDFRLIEGEVAGTEICLAIAGTWSFGDDEFFRVIRNVVSSELALFGSAPHERYLFVCDRNPFKGGKGFAYYGVHFASSMVLLLDPHIDRSELFSSTMGIVAHEFFHNWNGEAVRTDQEDFLWFIEGVTVYYSYRILFDANIITRRQHDEKREAIRLRYLENPYLERVTISESCNSDLDDRDMVNLLYDGGFLAAEAIDLRLREISGGRVDLVEIIKYVWEGEGIMNEQTLAETIETLCNEDLSPFISALIHRPAPEILVEPRAAS